MDVSPIVTASYVPGSPQVHMRGDVSMAGNKDTSSDGKSYTKTAGGRTGDIEV